TRLLLALATTKASTLRGSTSTSSTAAATSTTAAAASTAAAAASTTPTADTEAPTPPTTPTSTATPSASSTASTAAPTDPSTTLAPLALAVAAPPTRSKRSPDLCANEVESSSRSNRGEKGDRGTPLKERGARVAVRSTYNNDTLLSCTCDIGFGAASRGERHGQGHVQGCLWEDGGPQERALGAQPAANLISVQRLQKAGMDTRSKGAKTYTARLGERILWDLHEDRDVHNEMWQIPVVPMPQERQVAASISTKGEAVGSGDGANGRAKEIKSKKCNLGGTSKLGEHEESGAAAKKQHKGEENPKVAAEEDFGENISEATAKAPLDEVVMDVVGPLKLGAAGAE
ncbi:unnamed protein product, partial [Closterium sp. NIES-53]